MISKRTAPIAFISIKEHNFHTLILELDQIENDKAFKKSINSLLELHRSHLWMINYCLGWSRLEFFKFLDFLTFKDSPDFYDESFQSDPAFSWTFFFSLPAKTCCNTLSLSSVKIENNKNCFHYVSLKYFSISRQASEDSFFFFFLFIIPLHLNISLHKLNETRWKLSVKMLEYLLDLYV